MKRLTSAFLAVLMIFASLPVLADTGASSGVVRPMSGSITENHNQGDGVVMVKSATPHLDENGNPDGTIDIMIEAYTTGVVTNTTKVTPADIVLVLDMSGSMKDGEAYETVYTYNPVYGTEYTYREWNWSDWEYDTYTAYGFNNNYGEYYVLVNGEYQRVTRDSRDDNGFEYYYYGNRNNRTYVYPILDENPAGVARENNYNVVQFYTRTGERVQTSKARIDLLKEGVESFIAETLNSNKESGLTDPADLHSISIIKFADDSYYNGTRATTDVTQSVVGNDFNDDDYNYSQVVKELTTVNDAGAAELNAAVEALQPAGATAVDFGLALAQQVFNKAGTSETDNHRNQVLVVFTDGEPNHQNGYDSSVAATAVNYARAMKDAGVTVFTISVAEGSDSANITTNINRFMHYLSSNFPKSSANGTTLDDGVADSEVAAAMALGYYQTPDDNMSLASIFKTIAHTIESPTIELGEGATVVDTINPYFTLPEGTSEVSLYTSAKNATDWDDPKPAGSDVTLTVQNDRTIIVNGFDFDANYVSEAPRNGDYYGEKLIIVFNVVPDYEVLDAAVEEIAENGGMVPTNLGNATLTDSNMQTVAEVGSPTLQAYKVTYLVDGVEYKTVYRFAGADVTLIDEPADTAALDYGEWASDDVTIVDNGFTMPAEDVVIYLTSTRVSYKVTYRYTGPVPAGAAPAPGEETYDNGTTVSVAAEPYVEGYVFSGWITSSVTVTNGEFTMPAADVEFIGYFTAGTTMYTVEHYLQNADGTWPTDPTNSHTHDGTTGETVTARTDIVYPNFVWDEGHDGEVLSGVVAADGSLVLKLYYKRLQYNVTYEYVGTVPAGAPALPNNGAPTLHYYNERVIIADVPYVQGYTFVGWSTERADVIIEEDANGKYIIMPAHDVVLKGTFTANTGTIYTVEHWLETEDGKYELADSTERNGTTGTEANALPGNYPGYTYDPQISTASGIIKGDGSLVLKLYYNKTPYKVYYNITGNIPDGLEWTTKEETHEYTDTVTVLTAPVIAGYRFVGWTTDDVTIKDGEFTMPSYDVYLTGYYVATTAGYKVEHYFQEVDGTWPEDPTLAYNITGDIGAQVSADYLVAEGFTADRNHEGTLLAGEIKADGSLTLKLYYARNKYKVTYVYTGKVPAGAAEQLPEEATYYYGAEVDIAGQPYVSGYTFHGWTSEQIDVVGQTFDMPAKDVQFSGYFVAGPSYYTVEHYKQNLDGTYNATPDDSIVVSDNVKVGDYVTAEFMNYTGFTPAANNVFSGTVTPEPDTLVIKLYYERRSYNVYYEYIGVQPEGAPDVSVNNLVAVKYGEVVRVADIPTLADYAFDGWHTHTATVVGGEFTMPAHDVLFTGNFVLTRSSYRVEHYLQNLDGTWSDTTPYSQVISGTIGNTVSADYNDYTGFTPDLDNEKTVIEGVVNAEGTLVLKLYYERNKYTVTYVYGSAPDTAPALPAEKTYYYGENVTVADDPAIDHFTFTGWTTADATIADGKFDMPAKNVTITGSFTQDDFIYKVNYYVNDELYASYEVYSNDVHVIIDKPDYPAPLVFIGWSDPVNDATGKIVPVVNGAFVMPEANVSIFGSVESRLPINNEGRLTIGKELEAPDGFPKKTFIFDIYRAEGTRLTYVDTVAVKAGEEIALDLRIGVYYIYEKDAEVEGYTLFTTSDVTDNRVVIKAGRATSITFTNSYFTNILETEDHFAYVIGYPDGLVRPEANITRAEVATIFFRMLTDEAREQYWSKTNNFSDVSESDWFNNAISTLANAGVLNGYTDGTFKPNAYITRAELVKIAVSFYGTQAGKSTHFSDASEHWATDFIAAAEEFGFVDGYEDGTFRPDKYVTRAEAMKIINRTLDRNPHKDQLLDYMITWVDNSDTSKWYYADVQEATNSHTYTWDIYGYEIWDALLPVRDWAAFEKEWSTAYSD